MSKQRLCFYIVIAGLVILLGLLGLAIAHLLEYPPHFYYTHFSGLHELPTSLIRPIFRGLTEQIELSQKADGLRAIYYSSRDPAIFVRFQTDSEGIEYILEKFGGPDAKLETFDAGFMKALTAANVTLFAIPFLWQEKLGICLYDQGSIESGRKLRGRLGSMGINSYTIFIEDKNNIVYILIWHI